MLMGTLARYFPRLLGWRIRLIVFFRIVTYPLRFIPFSSKWFGPPKGEYKNLRHFARDPASRDVLRLIHLSKWRIGRRELPITNSRRVVGAFSRREHFKIFGAEVGILKNGRVWGKEGGAVITPDDKLIWELSPVNYTFRRDLHHVFARLKLPPVQSYPKVVNLVTRGAEDNFGHWVHDLLPRFDLLQKAGVDLTDAFYLVNHRDLPFQLQSLAQLGIPPEKIIRADEHVHIEAEELILPSLINVNMNTDGLGYPPEAYRFLQQLFLGKLLEENVTPARRIFISRQKSRRKVVNEDELYGALQSYGFEKVFLEDYTLEEQARLFHSAECVIAFHGAGLTNVIFCQKGTQIIEIFSPDFIVTTFWTFGEQLGLRYRCYCEDKRLLGVAGGRFQRVVETQISVPDFMLFFQQCERLSVLPNLPAKSCSAAVTLPGRATALS